jgi:hypothetical protein
VIISHPISLAAVTGNTFTGNGSGGIIISAENLADLGANTYNDKIGVNIGGGTITRNTTLSNLGGIPYYLSSSIGIASGATLTVNSGTLVKVAAVSGGLSIYGTLKAQGATFTDYRDDTIGGDTNSDGGSSSPSPGSWKGFTIQDGGSATFDQCVVRYAGVKNDGPAIYKIGAGSLS